MKKLLVIILSLFINISSAQIKQVPFAGQVTNIAYSTPYKHKIYFIGNDQKNSFQLFAADTNGISMVNTVVPSSTGWGIIYGVGLDYNFKMADLDGELYFGANLDSAIGAEVWKYTGSGAPLLVYDIMPGKTSSGAHNFMALNHKLYFISLLSAGSGLLEFEPATYSLRNIVYNCLEAVIFDNIIYLCCDDKSIGKGWELYCYDPVKYTLTLAADIEPGYASGMPRDLTVYNNHLYFSATTPAYGKELYEYTPGIGAKRISDVNPGPGNGFINLNNKSLLTANLTTCIGGYQGNIYFSGIDSDTICHMYKYDRSSGQVSNFYFDPKASVYAGGFYEFNGKFYFSANDTNSCGIELWAYSGTGNPEMVADIYTGTVNSNPYMFAVCDSILYFAARNAQGGHMYWLKDVPLASVQDLTFKGKVVVYPNPATDVATLLIHLEEPQKLYIFITDGAGRVVQKKDLQQLYAGDNKINISLHGFTQGVYYYNLCDNDGNTCAGGKLLKE